MNIIVMFDLVTEADVDAFKKASAHKGYMVAWTNPNEDGKTYYLPKNTMWKTNIGTEEALNEIKNIAVSNNMSLARCIIVPSAPWTGIDGVPIK